MWSTDLQCPYRIHICYIILCKISVLITYLLRNFTQVAAMILRFCYICSTFYCFSVTYLIHICYIIMILRFCYICSTFLLLFCYIFDTYLLHHYISILKAYLLRNSTQVAAMILRFCYICSTFLLLFYYIFDTYLLHRLCKIVRT